MNNNTTIILDNKLDELSKEIKSSTEILKEFKDTKVVFEKRLDVLNTSKNLWKKVYDILEDIDKFKFTNMIDEYQSYNKKISSLYNKLKKLEDDLVYYKV